MNLHVIDFGVQAYFEITALLSLQDKDQFGFSITYLAPAYLVQFVDRTNEPTENRDHKRLV